MPFSGLWCTCGTLLYLLQSNSSTYKLQKSWCSFTMVYIIIQAMRIHSIFYKTFLFYFIHLVFHILVYIIVLYILYLHLFSFVVFVLSCYVYFCASTLRAMKRSQIPCLANKADSDSGQPLPEKLHISHDESCCTPAGSDRGPPVDAAKNACQYFNREQCSINPGWRLRTSDKHKETTTVNHWGFLTWPEISMMQSRDTQWKWMPFSIKTGLHF